MLSFGLCRFYGKRLLLSIEVNRNVRSFENVMKLIYRPVYPTLLLMLNNSSNVVDVRLYANNQSHKQVMSVMSLLISFRLL